MNVQQLLLQAERKLQEKLKLEKERMKIEIKKQMEEAEKLRFINILQIAGYTDEWMRTNSRSFDTDWTNWKRIASAFIDFFGKGRRDYYAHTGDTTKPEDSISLAGVPAIKLFQRRYRDIELPPLFQYKLRK